MGLTHSNLTVMPLVSIFSFTITTIGLKNIYMSFFFIAKFIVSKSNQSYSFDHKSILRPFLSITIIPDTIKIYKMNLENFNFLNLIKCGERRKKKMKEDIT